MYRLHQKYDQHLLLLFPEWVNTTAGGKAGLSFVSERHVGCLAADWRGASVVETKT